MDRCQEIEGGKFELCIHDSRRLSLVNDIRMYTITLIHITLIHRDLPTVCHKVNKFILGEISVARKSKYDR